MVQRSGHARLRQHVALALLLLFAGASPPARRRRVPAGFVDAAAVVDGLVVDMRYFGDNNFVGEKIDGYERPRCLLSAQAANALAAVQRNLAPRGLGLKVFDCYRPVRAVAHFVRWARRIEDVEAQGRILSRPRQARSVQARLHRHALRTLARLDRRSHAGAARRQGRARHGHARTISPAGSPGSRTRA